MGSTSGMGSRTRLPPMLRSNAEQEQLCLTAVATCHRLNTIRPTRTGDADEHSQIGGYLAPRGPCPTDGSHPGQIIMPAKLRMGAIQPPGHHHEPAGHQPGGHLAVRVYFHRGPIKPLLPGLPVLQSQKQGPNDRTRRVLVIGNQLDRQQRKGGSFTRTFEPDNRNPLLPERREKFDRISPVDRALPVASPALTDRAGLSQVSKKIDLAGKKCIFVFPGALECVSVW